MPRPNSLLSQDQSDDPCLVPRRHAGVVIGIGWHTASVAMRLPPNSPENTEDEGKDCFLGVTKTASEAYISQTWNGWGLLHSTESSVD